MTPTVTLEELTHREANELWERAIADLDLYACFGKDTDPHWIAGDWWGALKQDGVTVGIIWFTRWIKGSDAVISVGRSLLPEFRSHGNANLHRDVVETKLKEVYPDAKTYMCIVYSTNPISLKAMINRGARLVGTIPCGDDVYIYMFVLKEWD